MSDIEFDHDVVSTFPPPLSAAREGLDVAATVPCPDTGPSTARTRESIDATLDRVAVLGQEIDDLRAEIGQCLVVYPETDGTVARFVDVMAEAVLR